jgi:serine/threonine-protein kinase
VTAGDRPIRDATISRDGRLLVLALEDGAYVRPLDRYELQTIPDSAELTSWVESPDGRSIAFFTTDDQILGGGTLRRMSFETGTTVTLHSSGEGMNPLLWLDDGILVHGQDSIRSIQLESNEVEVVMELERGHSHHASAVPGGKALLIELHDPGGEHEWSLDLVDLATREQRGLVPDAYGGVVTTRGHLLFLRDDTLIGSRFDAKALATVGDPVPLISGVRSFSVSEGGTLAYLPVQEGASVSRVVLVNREGQAETVYEGLVQYLRYGPDGRWISVAAEREFLLVDPRNGSVRPLLNEGIRFSDHVWRSDGKGVIYSAFPMGAGSSRLVEHPIDGGEPRILLDPGQDDVEVFPTGYAPDGSGFIFARYDKDDTDLWWMPADGKEPRELLATGAFEDLARFAPNGRWVAYESTESGRQEVWVAVFRTEGPRLAEKWKISQQGGRDPIWSIEGNELYYETFDGRLVAVAVASDPDGRPSFGRHEDLLDLRALGVAADGDESYDVAPDGSGWVAVQGGSVVSNEVRVVLNWYSELERLVKED